MPVLWTTYWAEEISTYLGRKCERWVMYDMSWAEPGPSFNHPIKQYSITDRTLGCPIRRYPIIIHARQAICPVRIRIRPRRIFSGFGQHLAYGSEAKFCVDVTNGSGIR
jgi:hypothetical protein